MSLVCLKNKSKSLCYVDNGQHSYGGLKNLRFLLKDVIFPFFVCNVIIESKKSLFNVFYLFLYLLTKQSWGKNMPHKKVCYAMIRSILYSNNHIKKIRKSYFSKKKLICRFIKNFPSCKPDNGNI